MVLHIFEMLRRYIDNDQWRQRRLISHDHKIQSLPHTKHHNVTEDESCIALNNDAAEAATFTT